jgi:hypothetical protein
MVAAGDPSAGADIRAWVCADRPGAAGRAGAAAAQVDAWKQFKIPPAVLRLSSRLTGSSYRENVPMTVAAALL